MGSTSKIHGFTSACEAARSVLGQERYSAVVAALPEFERQLAEKPGMPMQRIPSIHMATLLVLIADVGFASDVERVAEVGIEQMKQDMSGVYRLLIKVASLDAIIRKATSIYATYTDNGVMNAERVDSRRTQVSIVGVEHSHPSYWAYQRGCIQGVLNMAGHRVSVKLASGGNTSPRGEFLVEQLD